LITATASVIGLARSTEAQAPVRRDSLAAKVESFATATFADGLISGFSVAVKQGNDLLLAHGYGFADLENRVPAGPGTIYRIGSITKQFTAAAILRLVERGLVGLDDPITKFLPGYRAEGRRVTIRQLLTHTSGIRSYPSDDTPASSLPHDLSDAELRALIEAEPLEFEPGSRFRYSNAGYLLLGMIVAAASGQSYADYLRREIAAPLGLSGTAHCEDGGIKARVARGYEVAQGQRRDPSPLSLTHAGAAGALCSSVVDLLGWMSALRDGRVIRRASYDTMIAPAVVSDGTEVPYGFGIRPAPRLEGRFSVSHGGGINGFSSQLDYFPEADLTVAVISNTYGDHVRRLADAIARWVLGIPMPTPLDAPRTVTELDGYAGTYRLTSPDQSWAVVRRDRWLYLEIDGREPSRLRSQGDHVFVPLYNDFTRITFRIEDGRATGLNLHECVPTDQRRCRDRQGVRVP
jgi:CubicO group peptidase (beta-lactamase class C family)